MDLIVQKKLHENPKMDSLLKQNSYWYKDLNRSVDNYNKFIVTMKEKYRLKVTDKISDAIDNIDLISSILENLK